MGVSPSVVTGSVAAEILGLNESTVLTSVMSPQIGSLGTQKPIKGFLIRVHGRLDTSVKRFVQSSESRKVHLLVGKFQLIIL
jgi:hypothetical protein